MVIRINKRAQICEDWLLATQRFFKTMESPKSEKESYAGSVKENYFLKEFSAKDLSLARVKL
jgi:hypothetical protein